MFYQSLKHSFLVVILVLSFSCGKSTEEKTSDAILSANIHLSKRECQPAIDLLEGLGRQNKNAYYLKALSSAYACKAGYSTTKFFADDVALTATPAPLGGMTTYSTSTVAVTSPLSDDTKFRNLQTAIDILLYAGGIAAATDPSTTERAQYFSASQASDINSQLVFMMLAQAGKLMKVYSNAGATGVKGDGSESNTCLTDYSTTPAAVQSYITLVPPAPGAGATGACTSVSSSHSELDIGATDRRKRLCEGVVLLNNILHVLPGVIAGAGGGDLSTIANMSATIEAQKTALVALDPTFLTTATVLSQTKCETNVNIDEDTLASYFAVFFESLVL